MGDLFLFNAMARVKPYGQTWEHGFSSLVSMSGLVKPMGVLVSGGLNFLDNLYRDSAYLSVRPVRGV